MLTGKELLDILMVLEKQTSNVIEIEMDIEYIYIYIYIFNLFFNDWERRVLFS